MKEIWLRLRLESPLFFKRMAWVCFSLFIVSLFFKINNLDFKIYKDIGFATLGIGACGFGIFICLLTVKDKSKLIALLKQYGVPTDILFDEVVAPPPIPDPTKPESEEQK